MKKLLSILKYVLLALCVLAFASLFFLGEDGGTGVMLTWAYILLGLTLAVAIVFPIIHLVQNPKGAIRSLIGLVVVVVVIGLAYALSSDEPILIGAGETFTNSTVLRITDIGLYTAYFALGATVLAIIVGEIRNSIK